MATTVSKASKTVKKTKTKTKRKKPQKNLVIVESPAKANTIKKFLGGNSKVVASMGHIRDLPKSKLGVDIVRAGKNLKGGIYNE